MNTDETLINTDENKFKNEGLITIDHCYFAFFLPLFFVCSYQCLSVFICGMRVPCFCAMAKNLSKRTTNLRALPRCGPHAGRKLRHRIRRNLRRKATASRNFLARASIAITTANICRCSSGMRRRKCARRMRARFPCCFRNQSLTLQKIPSKCRHDPEQWLFLDTETTGLAGGTGTYPFWWASHGGTRAACRSSNSSCAISMKSIRCCSNSPSE